MLELFDITEPSGARKERAEGQLPTLFGGWVGWSVVGSELRAVA